MPTWMTLAPGPKRPIFPAASTERKKCQLVSGSTIHTYGRTTRHSTGTLGKSQFAACYEMLIVIGERTSTTGRSNHVMPAGHHRAGRAAGADAPRLQGLQGQPVLGRLLRGVEPRRRRPPQERRRRDGYRLRDRCQAEEGAALRACGPRARRLPPPRPRLRIPKLAIVRRAEGAQSSTDAHGRHVWETDGESAGSRRRI